MVMATTIRMFIRYFCPKIAGNQPLLLAGLIKPTVFDPLGFSQKVTQKETS